MDIEDIRDEETLDRWLKDRPREDAVAIAHRSALRVAPLWFRAMDDGWARKRDLTALPILRSNLTLGVARKIPTPKVSEALARAARAADATATAAADARASASAARASGAYAAASYIWEQIREDARLLLSGDDLLETRLWSIPEPDFFSQTDGEGRAIWAKDPATWDFWIRWWDGVITGKPLPWELQKEVALIDKDKDGEDHWKKGPAHIAEVIRGIESG